MLAKKTTDAVYRVEGSMGEHKRFALLVFVIIGALLIAGALGEHAAQAETKEVVASLTTSTLSTWSTRTAIPAASPSI